LQVATPVACKGMFMQDLGSPCIDKYIDCFLINTYIERDIINEYVLQNGIITDTYGVYYHDQTAE